MRKSITTFPKFLGVTLVLMLLNLAAWAQQVITGTVTDSKTGEPVAGVTVTIKGTGTSTQTDVSGNFRINAASSSVTLVFSSVGFGTREVNSNGQTAISVALTQFNQQLNEVVVVGYGTARRRDLTGAVTVVSSKDFQKGAITTPEQLIAGKVAGVSIINNGGAPGAGSTIRIRGGSSLNASNDPLIVIDGVPLDNGGISGAGNALSLINPNDIETFNILKDASATAIYGSRASNGVIIITTKKGTSGKMKINFNTQLQVATIANKLDVLTPGQFRDYVNKEGTQTQIGYLGSANTDWQDEIYQTAIGNDNNLSFSGTANNIPYRVSLGYLNQEGILRTGKLERASAGLNLSPKFFNNHLRVDISLKGSITGNRFANNGAIGSAATFDPTQPVRVNSTRYGGFYEHLDPNSVRGLNALSPRNPVGLLEQTFDRTSVKRSVGNIVFDYKFHFLPELRANLNLGYDVAVGTGGVYVNDSAAQDYRRYQDAGGIFHGGRKTQFRQERKNKVMEFYLNYVKEVKSIRSRFDLTAGYSYNDFLTTNFAFDDKTANQTIIPENKPLFARDFPQYTMISVYGRLNYSLMNKYLVTATIRRDGSSRFGKDFRWGNFPSVAVAWRLKEESFLKDSRLFSDLKLRASYGITGQQDGIGLYDYLTYYTLSANSAQYQFGNNFYSMWRPNGSSPGRKWEETATTNVGLDFGFLNNRITGSIEAYLNKTSDLLNEIDQPAGTNFSNKIVANVGTMENRGIEFNINADVIRTDNLVWSVNFNTTYNKNEITRLTLSNNPGFIGNEFFTVGGGTGNTLLVNTVGFPKSSFFVYKQVYDNNGNPIDGLYEDLNRDGLVNSADRYRYKNPAPEMFYGFSTNVTYKKWSAGFVLRASTGNYVYNNINAVNGNRNAVFGNGFLNNAYNDVLNTNFSGTKAGFSLSDYFIENASFLRMDNLTLGYDMGSIMKGKAHVRLNANVQNVFVITKYKGLDPEIGNGVDNNFYPRPRTFVIGANFDF